MGLADGDVPRGGNLVALVEATTVRDPAEGARLELRVVEVAGARKELVTIAEVVVNAHVESVDLFSPDRAGSEVVNQCAGCGQRIKLHELDCCRIEPVRADHVHHAAALNRIAHKPARYRTRSCRVKNRSERK